jgi:predicted NAD-dependent protein-ADP-ribosyltransferase YbiA (DUF1768 family)
VKEDVMRWLWWAKKIHTTRIFKKNSYRLANRILVEATKDAYYVVPDGTGKKSIGETSLMELRQF